MVIEVIKADTAKKCLHCYENDATVVIDIHNSYYCAIELPLCDSCRFELAQKLVEAH